jgi:hypothetical protein
MADAGIHVQEERADQPDVEALIRLSDEVAALSDPGEYRRPLNSRTLLASNVVILIARTTDGEAA